VKTFGNGSDHLEVSNNVNQPYTSYSRRSVRVKVDSNYQLTCDRERKMIKLT